MTKNKTIVKSKIILEDDGTSLTIYFWKKTFWLFGYWYPFGNISGNHQFSKERLSNINDNEVSKRLFELIKQR